MGGIICMHCCEKNRHNVEHYKHLCRKKYSDNLLALIICRDGEHSYWSNYIVLIYNLSYFMTLRAGLDQTLKLSVHLVTIWQVGLFIYCWLFLNEIFQRHMNKLT